ncbi:MAG: adenylate/guanylate cyclase domain-containing protein [Methylobacteriaceae bacterium]|nr:adenylate/guanylate cyclase domain-containing protein [Methylobacteriaceae bacterium]
MDEARLADAGLWVTEAGLTGAPEVELFCGFCERVRDSGVSVANALVIIDTLHPVHEGRAFRWTHEKSDESVIVDYGRTNQGGEAAERWQQSPMYHLMESGETFLRCAIPREPPFQFPILADLQALGHTDYIALIHRFAPSAIIGEMDCVYLSWSSDAADGFTDEEVEALRRVSPSLALAIKAHSLARIAETLVETYLGRDAGRRVLSGRIERGVADRIEAALWFSDLRNYTRITGAAPPEQIIPMLNDYAEAVISAIHEAGGDVLKLIGDGTLAIFNGQTPCEACRAALKAEELARKRIAKLNARREAEGLPTTQAYLGLHMGEVFYGNVGSQERLDFTVVGPAVNEASRIAALCRSADRDVLVSAAFRAVARAEDQSRLVSVGRYMLRGVESPQELFTVVADRPGGDRSGCAPVTTPLHDAA